MATLSPFWDSEWRLYRHFAMVSDVSTPNAVFIERRSVATLAAAGADLAPAAEIH
jgi:hypothetical protein